ncbi:unnamed protein product [Lota lota]
MERNMGEQVNKAFEVYRQASIEKDLAKKELEKMTEYYVRYTQELQQKIEDQRQLITTLESQLSSTANQPPGQTREGAEGGEGAELCVHLSDRTTDFRKTQHLENMESAVAVTSQKLPVKKCLDHQSMLEVFEAIQGKFQQIQILTRRQKDHLKRFHGGTDPSNDQQFSMPIQCTDDTAERAEGPGSSAPRAAAGAQSKASPAGATADAPQSSTALASRGASPQDRDMVDSLARLSVKFPPALDCEYDFLNSAPERQMRPPRRGMPPLHADVTEDPLPGGRAGPSFGLPPRPPSLTEESGPQQPLWGPVLRELEQGARGRERGGASDSSSPHKCAFCKATVPQDRMNSHLYLHFSHKNEASST